jgi:hypothetical protein
METTTAPRLTTTPCDKHDLTGCADCMDQARVRRVAGTNEVRWQGDCTVSSYQEITGAGHDEAVAALRAVGFIPGQGTPWGGIVDALRAAGYTVTRTRARYDTLASISRAYGRTFLVSGQQARKGHSWTIMDGTVSRGYRGRFDYAAFEVTA